MKIKQDLVIEWFLRIALSAGLLSAVADRFGLWSKEVSAWGNWENFVTYTQKITPLIPSNIIPFFAYTATVLEIIFGLLLLTNFKTIWVARSCGFLLLLFALAMTFSSGIKAPLDYSVFCASAGAFGLSVLVKKSKLDKFQN
jgi:thiosulfate dehydrogenase (quinone) large subunit